MAVSLRGGGEGGMSLWERIYQASSLNLYVMAIVGCKTRLNPQVIKEGFYQTPLTQPRFTSKLEHKGRKTRWIPTKINLDDHIIIPIIDSNMEFQNRFVDDYISNLTKTPLDLSKPLWELHILNVKTSDAEAVGVFQIHHSLGDGISLISLLLSTTQKTSHLDALQTEPSLKRESTNSCIYHRYNSFRLLFLAIWWWLGLIWHTVVDMVRFVLTIMFIKDTQTPLKGSPGVQLNTKRFVHSMISMDDIKLLKNEMKAYVHLFFMSGALIGERCCRVRQRYGHYRRRA
ncbi:wax ester synthase/diacylglycerol acyltransferase 11-like isoform X2 [Lotus japonicus]|uniref:wax ester synthase/diacylglycerol acyltransferase 11-like isoform X2 n=1 Tax=Lotus japonicus TaxID=34305 RepID=UPI0025836E73|nr:wax ester synthase/diacylglycerol acyltransferase 11-like isoform X2 [Lotus japonicus]